MIRALLIVLALLAGPALAVQPDEMLADPALEARAQVLDHELRCVRCRSESIASSNADWARDARLMVRELIEGGATDNQVKAFFVDRYGDFVLMRPTASGANLILWLAGPVMLLAAALVAAVYIRRRGKAPAVDATLTKDEERRLEDLLKD